MTTPDERVAAMLARVAARYLARDIIAGHIAQYPWGERQEAIDAAADELRHNPKPPRR